MTKWTVRTNRHPSTNGTLWGWIEGPDGNVCWADNTGLNSTVAGGLVARHNAGEDVTAELQALLEKYPGLGFLRTIERGEA